MQLHDEQLGVQSSKWAVRRALGWATGSAICWLLVAGLYVVSTSASNPDWAAAISLVLISIMVFVALVYSAFTVGYFWFLLVERRRLRKEGRAQS